MKIWLNFQKKGPVLWEKAANNPHTFKEFLSGWDLNNIFQISYFYQFQFNFLHADLNISTFLLKNGSEFWNQHPQKSLIKTGRQKIKLCPPNWSPLIAGLGLFVMDPSIRYIPLKYRCSPYKITFRHQKQRSSLNLLEVLCPGETYICFQKS